MRRKLWLLNLVLLGAVGWCGWHLRQTWLDSRARERALLLRTSVPLNVNAVTPVPVVPPITPANYFDVAQKILFSRDRNPNVVVDPPPPPPAPPPWPAMPVVYGFMNFGNPTVLLSEKAGAPQKGYHKGDSIGEMKIVDLDNQTITLEFDNRRQVKRYDELVAKAGAPAEPPPQQQTAAAAPAPNAGSLTGGATNSSNSNDSTSMKKQDNIRPGPLAMQTSETTRACSGDSLPAGTVQEGYKKVLTPTPFGTRCYWEMVK